MGLHESYPGDSTSRIHSGFDYAVDGQPFQVMPDYESTDTESIIERVQSGSPEGSQETNVFDFHSEVVVYASTVRPTDPHVMAALRTQSSCYAQMELCEAAGDTEGAKAAQRQLEIFTGNNKDLTDQANAIRREFVEVLAKNGFFVR